MAHTIKPGDVVLLKKSKDSLIKDGSYGIIEGYKSSWKGYSVGFNSCSTYLDKKREYASVNGGPIYNIPKKHFKPTSKTKIERFWNWGKGGVGPGMGVYFNKRVRVWEVQEI